MSNQIDVVVVKGGCENCCPAGFDPPTGAGCADVIASNLLGCRLIKPEDTDNVTKVIKGLINLFVLQQYNDTLKPVGESGEQVKTGPKSTEV